MKKSVFGSTLKAGVLAILAAASTSHAQELASKSFDIRPQSVSTALKAFASQSDMQLIFSEDDVGPATTRGVSGSLSPSVALSQMLQGTGLQFEFTRNNVVVVRRAAANVGTTTGSIGDQSASSGMLRVAQADTAAGQAVDRSAEAADPRTEEQRTGPQSVGLEEIVVTAQRRQQSLTNVPISMTVFDAGELESLRVQTTEDYILTVPNVTYRNNGGGPFISLRGISTFSGGEFDPIGIMIDESGYGATVSRYILSARFLDVERIEVLRGPQGTLTGRNALGGAINIISAQPRLDAFELKTTLDVGRFDSVFARGVVNLPVGETLALRAVMFGERSDGAMRNIGPIGGSSGLDDYGGRLAARWKPTENLTIDASFAYEEQDHDFANRVSLNRFTTPAAGNAARTQLAGWGGDYAAVDFMEDVRNNGGTMMRDYPEGWDMRNRLASLRATYEMKGHTLDLIYGTMSSDTSSDTDSDRSEFAVTVLDTARFIDTESVELKVTSDYDGAFNWVGGASYLYEEASFTARTLRGRAFGTTGRPTIGGDYFVFRSNPNYRDIESIGVFANAFVDLGERWHLSIGGRYSRESTVYGEGVATGTAANPAIDPRLEIGPAAKIDEFSPRVAVNFDLTPSATVYAQFATGYRAGYANDQPAIDLGAPKDVKPELVENYEIGFKGHLLDNRLSVALALFHMDYTDQQIATSAFDPELGINVFFDANAGSAYGRGFELELAARPFDSLELRAGIGYVDATIEHIVLNNVVIEDTEIPGIRPWTTNFTAIYTRPLTSALTLDVRADHTWQDGTNLGYSLNQASFVREYRSTNLSLGVKSARWDATAYIENALDETNWVAIDTGAARGSIASFIPRTYGLRMNFRFGD